MVEEKEASCMKRELLKLRIPVVSVTKKRVEEIFSVPETKRLWEELIDSPNFQKIANRLSNQENATKTAILQEAVKVVIQEGKSLDEAVQEKINCYQKEVYGNWN